ncbi:hypothetical protein HPSJM_00055 [Helicobacter pylori SJM180]|nr:hypothetical protein HPSJM_00055 [Helicobacter pylori SJM180]
MILMGIFCCAFFKKKRFCEIKSPQEGGCYKK